MTAIVSKSAINLRAKLGGTAPPASRQEDFWTQGDDATTTFNLPSGWKPRRAFVGGALMRPDSGNDYTVSFDGFTYSVVFAVAPGAVPICITGELVQ